MLSVFLLSVLSFPCAVPAPVAAYVLQAPDNAEIEAKIAAAGGDVAKLIELATTWSAAGQDAAAKKVYKKVLEIDATNEVAHKALNHQFYDKRWFDSFAELAKYKREEGAKMKGKGLAKFKDEWVPEADAPFLKMGWTKDDKGVWQNPIDAERDKQIAEWKKGGYRFRPDDNSWIAPADIPKWTALQWKCGDDWVDMTAANEYHSKIEHPWQLVGEHYEVWTTVDWDGGHLARWHADKTWHELVRLFGMEPTKKPHFFILNNLAQYNQAAGSQPILIESEGISSLHGAYFADAFFNAGSKPPQYLGCGVSYWDRKDEKIGKWGPYWLRWAAAQSFVDAIDPSWIAVGDWIGNEGRGDLASYAAPFWGEKKIPRWLRYGAASYVEGYMKNYEAAPTEDGWNIREFTCSQLKKAGGMHKMDDIFAFALTLNDPEGSTRLYDEAGLVVAFLLDGGEKDLVAKHQAFQAALKTGVKADIATAVKELQKSLVKHERDIKKFGGL